MSEHKLVKSIIDAIYSQDALFKDLVVDGREVIATAVTYERIPREIEIIATIDKQRRAQTSYVLVTMTIGTDTITTEIDYNDIIELLDRFLSDGIMHTQKLYNDEVEIWKYQ